MNLFSKLVFPQLYFKKIWKWNTTYYKPARLVLFYHFGSKVKADAKDLWSDFEVSCWRLYLIPTAKRVGAEFQPISLIFLGVTNVSQFHFLSLDIYRAPNCSRRVRIIRYYAFYSERWKHTKSILAKSRTALIYKQVWVVSLKQ